MDAIEMLDWGVYAHFDYSGKTTPELLDFMGVANAISGYAGCAAMLAVALALFVMSGRIRAAVVALASMAAGFLLMEGVQRLVPRRRPLNALDWLGDEALSPSFPAAHVLLFTLALILLGLALWGIGPRRWARTVFVVIAIPVGVWVAMSQFVLPFHFFTDTLGGLSGAGLIGWTAYLLMEAPLVAHSAVPTPAIQK